MVSKLQKNGNSVEYIEIKNGGHCLKNLKNKRMEIIADWFEK